MPQYADPRRRRYTSEAGRLHGVGADVRLSFGRATGRRPEGRMLRESAGYPCFSEQLGQMRTKALPAMSTITGNMIGNESTTFTRRFRWAGCGVLKCL
jgi:hypothetical protein